MIDDVEEKKMVCFLKCMFDIMLKLYTMLYGYRRFNGLIIIIKTMGLQVKKCSINLSC